jgi:hypothetical protein
MRDFAITWPVWFLVTPDSVIRDENGVPTGLTSQPSFDGSLDGEKYRLLAFTDSDLADRYVARHNAEWVKVAMNSPEELLKWLYSFARQGVTHLLFDQEPVGTLYRIQTVIDAMEKGPLQ